MLPSDPPAWCTRGGAPTSKDAVALPGSQWYWADEWVVDTESDATPEGSKDAEGWQYGTEFATIDRARPQPRAVRLKEDAVRRRRWVRPRLRLDLATKEAAAAHLRALATKLDAQQEMLVKMTDELRQKNSLVADYEGRIQTMIQRMAEAVATGDLRHIGLGTAGPTTNVGPRGARIVGGSPLLPSVRSIRGGGGITAAGSTPPGPGSGGDGWLSRVMKRFSAGGAGADGSPTQPQAGGGGGRLSAIVEGSPASPVSGAGEDAAQAAAAAAKDAAARDAAAKAAALAAFFKACEDGDLRRAADFIKAGADPAAVEAKSGRTALLYAARGGRLAMCQFLVKQGADLRASDKDGRDALHYAARRGHTDLGAWLLAQGLSVTSTDVHALTALHQATLGKSPAMCELLLGAGAELFAKDANGNTAFKLAKRFETDADANSKGTVVVLMRWAAEHPLLGSPGGQRQAHAGAAANATPAPAPAVVPVATSAAAGGAAAAPPPLPPQRL
jgi:hypothetical protein